MAEMIETINRLATEIGPRPAATEEEQQAALYIAEQLEAAGLPTEIEEFQGSVSHKKTRLACSALSVVFALVSLFVPVLALPAVIVAVVCAALFAAEELGSPVLSKVLDKGISQNVVARYRPESAQNGSVRRRKVVLVARTDSGSVQPELNGVLLSALPFFAKASRIGMLVLPILMLVKALFFLHSTGVVFVVMTVLLVLTCLCAALPALSYVMAKAGGLNDGANSSASGVAVMLEVARRISSDATEIPPVIHGAEAAIEAGVVPLGAELVYDEGASVSAGVAAGSGVSSAFEESAGEASIQPRLPADYHAEDQSESQRLLAAKAAIAAMTGRPVSDTVSVDLDQRAAEEAPSASEGSALPAAVAAGVVGAAAMAVPAAVAAGAAAGFSVGAAEDEIIDAASDSGNLAEVGSVPEESGSGSFASAQAAPVYLPVKNEVPSWFSAGRAAARHNESDAPVIKRNSRAAALEAAEQRLNALMYEESVMAPDIEERLQQLQEAAQGTQVSSSVREGASEQALQEPGAESAFPDELVPAFTDEPAAQPSALTASGEGESASPLIALTDFAASPLVAEVPVEEASSREPSADEVVPASLKVDLPAIEAASEVTQVERAEESEPTAVVEPAPIPMDYFMAAAVGVNAGDTLLAQPASSEDRQPLTLPDLSATGSIPLVDTQKQRAPLAEAEESGQNMAKSLLTMLPSIESTPSSPDLRATLPSLSGALERVPSSQSPSLSQQFEPIAGATGSFAPVTEALVLDAEDEGDLFVEDADDSSFEENYTETGAFAGPEYMDMPKKRGLGIFDKLFGRKKEEETVPTNEWLDVDEDFDAREVGAARSSWESFRQDEDDSREYDEDYEYDADDYGYEDEAEFETEAEEYEDDYSFEFDDDEKDDWKGGAFSGGLSGIADGAAGVASRVRGALPGSKKDAAKDERAAGRGRRHLAMAPHQDAPNDYEDQAAVAQEREDRRAVRRAENDEYARVYQMIASRYEAGAEGAAEAAAMVASETTETWNEEAQRQITNFRANGIDTEVWFVALGAETDCHAGMAAFIDEHKPDLRGAIVIELDSLGAGVLSVVSKEGVLRPVTASSRMRRYANRASQSSGVAVETASILWSESAASLAIRRGLQAMHLVGMDGDKPALYAQADDVAENINPEILAENANFVVEVIKNV